VRSRGNTPKRIHVLGAFCTALLALVLTYAIPLLPGPYVVHCGNSSLHDLYTVHSYGDVTLLLLNRSALRYVNGFWVTVLEDIGRVGDIAEEILDIVGDCVVQTTDVIVEDGKPRTLRGIMSRDVSEVVSALVDAGLRNGMLRINILGGGSLWLRIERRGANGLGAEKLVRAVTSAVHGKRVVVQEVVCLSRVPSYFDAPDLYRSLMAIPCFTSLAETPYGLVIVFNQVCAQEIAVQTNTSLDRVMEGIVGKLRDAAPLLRRYISCREPLVFFAKIYPIREYLVASPSNLPGEIARVDTGPKSNAYAEIPQAITRANTPSAIIEGSTPTVRYGMISPLTIAATTLIIAMASLAIAIRMRRA